MFVYLLICGFIADVVSDSEIMAKNGYSYGSNAEGKDRSLLAIQSRNLPTVTEKIRKETSLACVPAMILTHYLSAHISEATAKSAETSVSFCVTTPFTVHSPFPWFYTHNYMNFSFTQGYCTWTVIVQI